MEIEVARGVRTNSKRFNTLIGIYSRVMGKTLSDVVKNQARLLARDACDLFPPFSGSAPQITKGGEGGFGLRARNKGRAAVNRDIRHIFAPLAQAPAGLVAQRGNIGIFDAWIRAKMKTPPPHQPAWLFDLFNKNGGLVTIEDFNLFLDKRHGNFSGKGNIMMDESIDQIGVIHRFVRGKPDYRVNKNRVPDFYVRDWKLVEKYIKKTQERVGKLKSGWYAAGKALGKMPEAKWISEHGSKYGICEQKLQDPLKPVVKIGNTIARSQSQGWHLFQKAWNHRDFAMRTLIYHKLKGQKNQQTLLQAISTLEKSDKSEN
jgi:hypothetical protein